MDGNSGKVYASGRVVFENGNGSVSVTVTVSVTHGFLYKSRFKMTPHLKIIIPAYNSLKWIRKTLHSVTCQTYRNYEVCIIDDASTQQGQQELLQKHCARYQWKAIFRKSNQGALANIVDGIKALSPQDEDLILLLDGDDWLYHQHVFARIAQEYASPTVMMTYGQFITYPRWQLGSCKPLTEQIYRAQNFRQIPFIFSHLRTFKAKLWHSIQERDFKDGNGCFFRTAWDLAILYPLLELSGAQGCKFIEDVLYVYNMDNPLNDCIAHKELQSATALEIAGKKPYTQRFYSTYLPYTPKKRTRFRNRWISLYRKVITPAVYLLAVKKVFKSCARSFRCMC